MKEPKMDTMTRFATPEYKDTDDQEIRHTLVAEARALLPTLRAHAAESEKNRAVPIEIFEEMQAKRLLDVCKPKQFGGLALGWDVLCEIAMTLAEGCASTAWLYAVFAEHNNMLTMWSQEAQDEIWGEFPNARIASSKTKTGELMPVEGGYKFQGIATFSSGCNYADWFLSAFVPIQGGGVAFILLPREDVTILNTWHAMGMAATCSHDILISETFIPEHRVFQAGEKPPGWGSHAEPVFRQPRFSMGPYSLASVCVGIAGGFIDQYSEYMRSRVSRFGDHVADFQSLQLRIAEASAEFDAAKLMILHNMRQTMDYLSQGEVPIDIQARNKRDMGYCPSLAVKAVDKLFYAGGTMVRMEENDLQRKFRDIQTASSQFFLNWDINGTLFGRQSLGLPVDIPNF
jgi:alkylation response protein AidB-like acyl-CoA dehydrogenase